MSAAPHASTGPVATATSLIGALISHLAAVDVPLHAIASVVAIVAGLVSIVHYVRQWLRG